ncbi:hypothetical protein Q428_11320 [Fervidicella metallireducens AeB]|uniref:Uncharacterized protein n=1 Tax=Fervidicella metallireducens AeB TaxID=1403537 RepID=A0A017RSP1_9CLOT|nr:hypothetical protein [Fervidicella metallireducens]EYE87783.1 hypothetical protein Q428_11320 [Fervidicella metallireducens AeB]
MTVRQYRYTNINGHQVEFAQDFLIPQDRHTHREAKSQKAQLESVHKHGTSKHFKIPLKHRLT